MILPPDDAVLSWMPRTEVEKYVVTCPKAVWAIACLLAERGKVSNLQALLLDGPPGVGKTFLAEHTQRKMGAQLLRMQCYPGCGIEDFLRAKEGTERDGFIPALINASHQGPVVGVVNEIDKGGPEVDDFWLEFLNGNYLKLPGLPEISAKAENLLVVFTKNDRRRLEEAFLRRVVVINLDWPEKQVEAQLIADVMPWCPAEMISWVLDKAQRWRQHPEIRKKPSTPELIRLLGHLGLMLTHKIEAYDLGDYFLDGLLADREDQRHSRGENRLALGLRLQTLARSASKEL